MNTDKIIGSINEVKYGGLTGKKVNLDRMKTKAIEKYIKDVGKSDTEIHLQGVLIKKANDELKDRARLKKKFPSMLDDDINEGTKDVPFYIEMEDGVDAKDFYKYLTGQAGYTELDFESSIPPSVEGLIQGDASKVKKLKKALEKAAGGYNAEVEYD